MSGDMRNPRQVFGMAALKFAMLAKLGEVTTADAERLLTQAQILLPADERVASAVASFAAQVCAGDQCTAGKDLHNFLSEWTAFSKPSDWVDRKDCGHG